MKENLSSSSVWSSIGQKLHKNKKNLISVLLFLLLAALTFSAICDDFVKAEGFKKVECDNEPAAKQYAANMSYESDSYPVVYFKSDTTGEKAYEEFYVPGEQINMERYMALGVVEETTRRPMEEVNQFFIDLETLFSNEDFTKAQVVEAIKKFIPNFEHEETGKNLDQKM